MKTYNCHKCNVELTEDNFSLLIRDKRYCVGCEERENYLRLKREYLSQERQLSQSCEVSEKEGTERVLAGIEKVFVEYCEARESGGVWRGRDLGDAMINTLRKTGRVAEGESLISYFEKRYNEKKK